MINAGKMREEPGTLVLLICKERIVLTCARVGLRKCVGDIRRIFKWATGDFVGLPK